MVLQVKSLGAKSQIQVLIPNLSHSFPLRQTVVVTFLSRKRCRIIDSEPERTLESIGFNLQMRKLRLKRVQVTCPMGHLKEASEIGFESRACDSRTSVYDACLPMGKNLSHWRHNRFYLYLWLQSNTFSTNDNRLISLLTALSYIWWPSLNGHHRLARRVGLVCWHTLGKHFHGFMLYTHLGWSLTPPLVPLPIDTTGFPYNLQLPHLGSLL